MLLLVRNTSATSAAATPAPTITSRVSEGEAACRAGDADAPSPVPWGAAVRVDTGAEATNRDLPCPLINPPLTRRSRDQHQGVTEGRRAPAGAGGRGAGPPATGRAAQPEPSAAMCR